MADLDKVPGMRKNGEPIPTDDPEELNAEELVDALNAELAAWQAQGLTPQNLVHDINALDVQIQTVVWTLIDMEIITEEELNLRFRRRMLKKLVDKRREITKHQITSGVQKPNIILPGR